MNTDRRLQDPKPSGTRGRKRLLKWAVIVALFLMASVSVSCGKPVPPYWPDLAVVGETVYVAEMNGQVFALQAETGDTMWSYPIIEKRGGGLLAGCSAAALADGPFASAPVVSDQFILLGSAGEQTRSLFSKGQNMSGLRALNSAGILQWEFRGTQDRIVASPALSEDTVYLASSDHSVYAIDLETREARWAFETENWVWASPLVSGNSVFIASMDHRLYAVDVADGSERWRFEGSPGALPAAPALVDGILYFGALDGHVYAVDAESGARVWERQLDGGVWATPRMEDGTLHLGTLKGMAYALDATDGSEVWKTELEGEIRGSPAYANGILYYGSENGKLYALDAATGATGISPLGQQIDSASIYTSPVFDGKRLYVVVTDGQVFALDLERNVVVWKTNPLDQDQEES